MERASYKVGALLSWDHRSVMHPVPTSTMPAAVTHDDLSLRKAQERRAARSGSQVAVSLVALSIICGLVAFVLCLAAEGSRSEASHLAAPN